MTPHENQRLACCLALTLTALVARQAGAESNIGWPSYGGADGGGHYSGCRRPGRLRAA